MERMMERLRECLLKPITTALARMERHISMKLSDMKGEIVAARAQIAKIATEQQTRFDKLQKDFDDLKQSILDNDPELPAEIVQDLTDFKADLQKFDDTIIDTETPPPNPEPPQAKRH